MRIREIKRSPASLGPMRTVILIGSVPKHGENPRQMTVSGIERTADLMFAELSRAEAPDPATAQSKLRPHGRYGA